MTAHLNGALLDPFTSATRVRIANLTPTLPDSVSSDYIEAVVALVWPYSSSTRVLSLLLAEPEVRLRKGKGQVKISFQADSAGAVAKSQVGIGDLVRLRLSDATWRETGDAVSTPGKKVDWDLEYKRRVVLAVSRNGEPLAGVDFESKDSSLLQANSASINATEVKLYNRANGEIRGISIRLSPRTIIHSHRVTSGSFLDGSLDPFVEEDGYVVGKGRKRTKFARHSGSWKLLDDAPIENSPRTEKVDSRTADGFCAPEIVSLDDTPSPEPSSAELDAEKSALMPPPKTPARRRPTIFQEMLPASDSIVTPRLHPLLSPGLPLVSPLVKATGVTRGYFDEQQNTTSELDAISQAPTSPATMQSLSTSHDRESSPVENPGVDAEGFKGSSPVDLNKYRHTALEMPSTPPGSGDSLQDNVMSNQEVPSSATPAWVLSASTEDFSQGMTMKGTQASPKQQILDQDEEEDMYGASEIHSLPQEGGASRLSVEMEYSNLGDKLGVPVNHSEAGQQHSALSLSSPPGWQNKSRKMGQSPPQPSFPDSTSDEVSQSDSMEAVVIDGPLDERRPLNSDFRETSDSSSSQSLLKSPQQLFSLLEGVPELLAEENPSMDLLLDKTQAHKGTIDPPGPGHTVNNIPFSINSSHASQTQLLTPNNTQQDYESMTTSHAVAEILENQMPPTPENTQESHIPSLPNVDGGADVQFTKEEDAISALIPTTEIDPLSVSAPLSRSVRKLLNLQGVSSPYFTPRRSTRITPDLQSPTFRQKQAPLAAVTDGNRHATRSQDIDVDVDGPINQTGGVAEAPKELIVEGTFKIGLSSALSYYVPLSKLSEYYNQHVDVFAVCTTTPGKAIRARSGPRDYNVTLHTADPSLNWDLTITVQLFRPHQKALPHVQRGDVILLRAMKVLSQKRKCMLLTTDSSAWAVYSEAAAQDGLEDVPGLQVKVQGPPVEFGTDEVEHAKHLISWWRNEGSNIYSLSSTAQGQEKAQDAPAIESMNDLHEVASNGLDEAQLDQNPLENPNNAENPRATRSSRRLANRTDNIETVKEAVQDPVHLSSPPQVPRTSARLRRHSRSISAVSLASSDSPAKDARSEHTIHELRDGTRYVDEQVSGKEHARSRKEGIVVHQLRDGVRWVDK